MVSSKANIVATFFALLFLLQSSPAVFSWARLLPQTNNNVTALFALGDSTIDPGNNNHLNTAFRSDHAPYGESFPDRNPTGRFSDGRLATDFMASYLGLKLLLPAYLDDEVTDSDLMTGVSFGSAGSGLDDVTANTVNVLTMDKQLENFDEAVKRIENRVGSSEARRIVNNGMFVISAGTNDVVFNFYVLPISQRRSEFDDSIAKYHDFLLQKLQSFIEALHKRGARRFAVAGLPPVGCLPLQITLDNLIPGPGMLERACVMDQNHDSRGYNNNLKAILTNINSLLQGATVRYGDIYTTLMNMVRNPSNYGFDDSLRGCCGFGVVAVGPLCGVLSPTCRDPSRRLFWDSIHPSEAANSYLAKSFEETAFN